MGCLFFHRGKHLIYVIKIKFVSRQLVIFDREWRFACLGETDSGEECGNK
jgi:hypothetical protein